MNKRLRLLKKAIKKNKLNDFFLKKEHAYINGRDVYFIEYDKNIIALCKIANCKNEQYPFTKFKEWIHSTCNTPEGIYISLNYICALSKYIRNGECNIFVDIKDFSNILSYAINENKETLKNTNIETNNFSGNKSLYEMITNINKMFLIDNGFAIFIE